MFRRLYKIFSSWIQDTDTWTKYRSNAVNDLVGSISLKKEVSLPTATCVQNDGASLNQESIGSPCIDIYRNLRISKKIRKSMDNWRLISIMISNNFHAWISIHGNSLRISIAECPFMDIPAWVSMWIFTLVWILKDNIQKSWISCWYPWIFGNPCLDMLWILGPGKCFLPWN